MSARRVILVESICKEGVMRRMPVALLCSWCDRVHEIDADQLLEAAEDFPYELDCACGGRLRVFPTSWPIAT